MVEPREWLIRKDGYFYRPNCAGYTTSKFEAGRYTKAEAEREAAVEPWHMKAIHQDDVEDDPVSSRVRMDGETIASLKARISELERALAERAGGVRFVGNIPGSSSASGFVSLSTEPAVPEGRQEAGRIGDAVLDWMVKFDLLDAGNEYYVSDVLAVLNDLTPSTRPSEQAVTEAMVERLAQHLATDHIAIDDRAEYSWNAATEQWRDSWRRKARAALKAAMEAGR